MAETARAEAQPSRLLRPHNLRSGLPRSQGLVSKKDYNFAIMQDFFGAPAGNFDSVKTAARLLGLADREKKPGNGQT